MVNLTLCDLNAGKLCRRKHVARSKNEVCRLSRLRSSYGVDHVTPDYGRLRTPIAQLTDARFPYIPESR